MKKFTTIILAILMLGTLSSGLAFAAEAGAQTLKDTQFDVGEYLNLGGEDQGQEYFGTEENRTESPITEFILSIINFAIRIIGSIAIIILIIGGFMFMFAQGNQQKLDEAKDIVKYAIIGLLVTFLSYIIVISVQSIFIPKSEVETPQTTQQQ
ncbi:MAG: hypothetical protein ABIH78_00390 [Candidatus Peregrinibacteria bacterium]